jgi:hypothetical protein
MRKVVSSPRNDDEDLMQLAQAVIGGDRRTMSLMLIRTPTLARSAFVGGATRAEAAPHFLKSISHYIYEGDTALHIAAAAYQPDAIRDLVAAGSVVRARNRRGAEPLHYASDGGPNWWTWNPRAQEKTVATLIELGADPNALDKSGVAPLHRAVRTRCTGAVRALLAGGANPRLKNKSGSTPMSLARQTTGRGGSGLQETRREQAEIVRLLAEPFAS